MEPPRMQPLHESDTGVEAAGAVTVEEGRMHHRGWPAWAAESVGRLKAADEEEDEASGGVDGVGKQEHVKCIAIWRSPVWPTDSVGQANSADDEAADATSPEDEEGMSRHSSQASGEERQAREQPGSQIWLTDMEVRLQAAQEVGRAWRRRVRRPMLGVAVVLMPGGIACWQFLEWGSPLMTSGTMLAMVGNMALFLSLIPTDRFAIKWTGRFYLTLGILSILGNASAFCSLVKGIASDKCVTNLGNPLPCSVSTVRTVTYGVFILGFLFVVWWFIRRMGDRRQVRAIEVIWRGFGMSYTLIGISWTVAIVIYMPYDHMSWSAKARNLATSLWVIAIASVGFTPGFRARFQAWLAWHGGEKATAARIAELLGQRPAHEVMESANASFRCVRGDAVTREGMANNSADVSLRHATVAAFLGQVDAFVSHSWHDNADAKWAALQGWRHDFVKRHGEEPKLWIDKFCIDAGNLDEGLRCLPLYVAGCNKLLVLCGETYVRRAWCLLEIFVFVAMGGELEDIEVRFLAPPPGADAPPAYELMIDSFDAAMATCSLDEDTNRLQAIFTAGFSDAASLTDIVKGVFKRCHAGFEVVN